MNAAETLTVPDLVLGTMTFGSQVELDDARRMVAVCRDAGITMIDTANVYSGGRSESIIGEVVTGKDRDEVLLASKVGMPSPESGDAAPLSRSAIRSCLHASLRRLQTDHLDVYYLHQPDRTTPIEETMGALNELVDAGEIGAIGVSNYAAWQIAELINVAEREGWAKPMLSQPLYNLIARRIEAEYVEFSQGAGLTNIVYNPLGGGLLTGKHAFDQIESGGRFGDDGLGPMYRQRYWNRQLFDAVAALQAASTARGLTLVEASFRWLLSRPAVGSVLIGASSLEHLESNIVAARGPGIDDELAATFDEIWRTLDGPAPAYNR